MSNITPAPSRHTWRFVRAGGFDQVRLDTGADLAALPQLDQKLWVALACPTRGLEFDSKTLDLIDTDKDGRIRAPEILAATQWACAMLKNPDALMPGSAALPLDTINDANPEGKQLLSSARQILQNLGKADATAIDTEDTADTAKIFAQTKFNGDGVVPAESADDPEIQSVITDVIACLGSQVDRSGKPGITQEKLEAFYKELQAYEDWWAKAEKDAATILPLGPATLAAAAALQAVAGKIDDYFARCRLAAYDPRALAALNRDEKEYQAIALQEISAAVAQTAGFPLAQVGPDKALPLNHGALNPAWTAAMATLRTAVLQPLLGDVAALTPDQWALVRGKFAPCAAWSAAKTGAAVEKLGLARVRQILAGPAHESITALLAKDKALEPEANAIAAVDRLVRYHRDLHHLLNNFICFHEFYRRRDKAVFQAGVLYLDQRSCELCVRVDDAAKHATMAHLAYTYLAYCDVVRKATGEKMTIAAAFTAGDSDNLMVGRNGVFYDRKGQDWDATITKIIENPISIRQAFWAPYKRVVRWIEDQVAKRAAAADAAAHTRLQAAATDAATAAATGVAPPPPPPAAKVDVGVVAALGVAFGAITTAFGVFLTWLTNVSPMYIPLYIAVLILLISLPSMILAWLKLRQRNLGPILDANGWAVNARARINIPFGGSLTRVAVLPPGSARDLRDPFAESHAGRNRVITLAVVLGILLAVWYFGCVEKWLPEWFPASPYQTSLIRRDADKLLNEGATQVDSKNLDGASATLTKLRLTLKPKLDRHGLGTEYEDKIGKLSTALDAKAKAIAATQPK